MHRKARSDRILFTQSQTCRKFREGGGSASRSGAGRKAWKTCRAGITSKGACGLTNRTIRFIKLPWGRFREGNNKKGGFWVTLFRTAPRLEIKLANVANTITKKGTKQ